MAGTCTPEQAAEERFPTVADVAAGRLFRYMYMDVSYQRVTVKISGPFKAKISEWDEKSVTLCNIAGRRLGEPTHQSSGLGSWSGYIFDYAENFDAMRRTAIDFVLARKKLQAEQLRNYAQMLEEHPIEYEEIG
jgi:hypothetical protein